MILDRIYPTSLALPDARDFVGHSALCLERLAGAVQGPVASWLAIGGPDATWIAQTPSYVGTMAGLPLATNLRLGAFAIIDQTAPGGLLRPPAAGVKMRRITLEVTYAHDGATKVWRPRGQQTLYQFGGINASPAGTRTAAAAAEIISEIGQIPAGLLNVTGTILEFRLEIGRTTPATATVDVALTMGPTPGTLGTNIGVVSAMLASNLSTAWVEGFMLVADTTHQAVSFSVAPEGKANIGVNVPITLNLAVAQTLQVSFANATVADTMNFIGGTVSIR